MTDALAKLQTLFAGRYVPVRELGRGGMGTVYLMRDLRHERSVAMKVLRPEMAALVGAERFLREIRVTAGLQHPHILPLFDSGEADGLLYYVMPYVEGETLRDRMDRVGRLEVADAVSLVAALASGLDYAHARGIVHRDIKPENVLLGPGGPMLVDFGIARASTRGASRLTETGMSLGTPVYMSPEQASGELEIDGRSDLYSLAVLLYEMLAGRPPFDGPNMLAITAMKLKGPAPSVRVARADLPPAIERALDRALAMLAEDRFQTVGAFVAALADDAPIPARRVTVGSVAVLPFANLSHDPEDEYLSDGLAEELIHVLSGIDGLRVVARSSSFAFKGRNEDARRIGEALGVDTLLEGSVRRAGARLRVSASLIDARHGSALWSGRFDRPCDDVFAVQDEIAAAVGQAFQQQLAAKGTGSARSSAGFRAYDLFLRGRQAVNRRTDASLREGLEWFDRALTVDPEFAAASSARAHALVLRALYGHAAPEPTMLEAERAARHALAIEPELAEAAGALGCIQSVFRWDWAAGEATLRQAIGREPTAITRQWLAIDNLAPRRRFDDARAELAAARRLDPLAPAVAVSAALVELMAGETDRAIEGLRQVLAQEAFAPAHLFLGEALAQRGALDEAIATLETAAELSGRSDESLSALGHALATAGRADRARELQAELERGGADRYLSPSLVGRILLGLGELDRALDRFEEAIRVRCPFVIWLGVRPIYAPLRSSPRFTKALASIGLES
ncbi:MAG: protein kinase [Gemmatimonadales bacterium]